MRARKKKRSTQSGKRDEKSRERRDETRSGTFLPVKAALCSDVSPMLLDRLTSAPACRVRTLASARLSRGQSFNCETPQPYL